LWKGRINRGGTENFRSFKRIEHFATGTKRKGKREKKRIANETGKEREKR